MRIPSQEAEETKEWKRKKKGGLVRDKEGWGQDWGLSETQRGKREEAELQGKEAVRCLLAHTHSRISY